MSLSIYFQCFLVALIGWAIHTALKMRALQTKARVANAAWSPVDYFKEDYLSVIVSILTILLFLFLIKELIAWHEKLESFILSCSAFIGYASSDIASRLFSVANDRLNKIIDKKTDIADGK